MIPLAPSLDLPAWLDVPAHFGTALIIAGVFFALAGAVTYFGSRKPRRHRPEPDMVALATEACRAIVAVSALPSVLERAPALKELTALLTWLNAPPLAYTEPEPILQNTRHRIDPTIGAVVLEKI